MCRRLGQSCSWLSVKMNCEADQYAAGWPKHLHVCWLGYSCSKQASARFALHS